MRIGRVTDSLLRRHLRLKLLTYGWYPRAARADGRRALRAAFAGHEIDVIVASYTQPVSHRLVAWAGREFGVPWVADFRDTAEMIGFGFFQRPATAVERSVVSSSARIITTSPTLKRYLERRHRQPVDVIENGFDPEDYDGIRPVRFDRFTIVHNGQDG